MISQELLNTGLNEESKSSTHYCPPFSIVNPVDKKVIMKDGRRHVTYGRNYSYGFCDAFSDDHSDFGRLYKLITSKYIYYLYNSLNRRHMGLTD